MDIHGKDKFNCVMCDDVELPFPEMQKGLKHYV